MGLASTAAIFVHRGRDGIAAVAYVVAVVVIAVGLVLAAIVVAAIRVSGGQRTLAAYLAGGPVGVVRVVVLRTAEDHHDDEDG